MNSSMNSSINTKGMKNEQTKPVITRSVRGRLLPGDATPFRVQWGKENAASRPFSKGFSFLYSRLFSLPSFVLLGF